MISQVSNGSGGLRQFAGSSGLRGAGLCAAYITGDSAAMPLWRSTADKLK